MADDPRACPDCRAVLPPDARFCPQCGTRLVAPGPSHGERRPVAILFADLANFTSLTSEGDAEAIHALLGRFFEVVDGVIARAGGTIDKHIGDATMAVFGAPVAHGNDVERAVLAACEIHDAIAALSHEFARPLATHIGIACGEVVAASVGSTLRADYTVTGDAVNLASRLEELAAAGETIVSDDVRRALGARLGVEARGTVAVRGFAGGLAVWRVVGLRADGGEPARLVGRFRERSRFADAIVRMRDTGRGLAWLVRGDPGLGKTRLVESLIEDAGAAGCACHAVAVLDFGAGRAREATNLIARSLLGVSATDEAAACRAALDRALAEGRLPALHAPFVADLLDLGLPAGDRYESMDHAMRAQARIDALVELATGTARTQPLVVVIEDVHWASRPVLDALDALAERAAREPMLVVMTTRRDGDPVTGAWQRDRYEALSLEPLSTDESLELAHAYLAARPDVARRCVERAQGNPLFLTQLLQSGADGESVPATIGSVVLARLDRLPPAEKAALQAASVAGQRFDGALVAHIAGGTLPDLDVASARDLVRRRDDGEWMFAHALIRDGVYASLLHASRRTLHRRAADWYRGRDAGLRAEHLARAEDAEAPKAFLDAAREAVAALRPDVALSLAQRGAEIAREATIAYGLEIVAGEAARDVGDAATAANAFARAVELAGDDEARCHAAIGVASAHRLTTSTAAAFAALDVASPLAERLGLARERARIAYLRGCLHFALGDVGQAAAQHERALAAARQAGDEACQAQALSGLADLLYANGRIASAYAAFAECVDLCERRGARRDALMNRNMMGLIAFYVGRMPQGLELLERTREAARELGHRVAEVMADECIGLVLVGAGRDDEAIEPLERSLALARTIASRRFAAIDLAMLGIVARRAGDTGAARARLEEAWSILEEIGPRFAGPLVLGALAELATDDDERRAFLARGETLLAGGALSHNHFWFRASAIEASLAANDAGEAERHAGELERYAAPEPTPWSDFVVARARALVDVVRGAPDAALLARLAERASTLDLRAAAPALRAAHQRR